MSNSELDLDTLVLAGSTREIFNPSGGTWTGASSRIYVATHRGGAAGVIQIGYDPELDKSFVRARSDNPEGAWSTWLAVEAPPPPPEARKAAKTKADEDEETEVRSKKK